jgi:putative Holliday junction resolvase
VRILGIDYGRARLGLAMSDESGVLASPLPPHRCRRTQAQDIRILAQLIARNEVSRIVVGLPLHMNGSAGEMAHEASEFAAQLSQATGRPVEMLDERLTTTEADRVLREAAVPRKKRKELRDGLAAVQILQSFLDRRGAEE